MARQAGTSGSSRRGAAPVRGASESSWVAGCELNVELASRFTLHASRGRGAAAALRTRPEPRVLRSARNWNCERQAHVLLRGGGNRGNPGDSEPLGVSRKGPSPRGWLRGSRAGPPGPRAWSPPPRERARPRERAYASRTLSLSEPPPVWAPGDPALHQWSPGLARRWSTPRGPARCRQKPEDRSSAAALPQPLSRRVPPWRRPRRPRPPVPPGKQTPPPRTDADPNPGLAQPTSPPGRVLLGVRLVGPLHPRTPPLGTTPHLLAHWAGVGLKTSSGAPSFVPSSSPAPSGCLCAPPPPGEEWGGLPLPGTPASSTPAGPLLASSPWVGHRLPAASEAGS